MTRTTHGIFFEGEVSAGNVGANSAQTALDLLTAILARSEFATGGQQWWSLYHTVSASDKVWKCVGNPAIASGAGDTTYFMRAKTISTTGLQDLPYADWSTASSTGSSAIGGQNRTVTASTALKFAGMVSEYEFLLRFEQGANRTQLGASSPARSTYIPHGHSGVAFGTSAVTGGAGNQQLPVDRSLVGLLKLSPRYVWMLPITPLGDALVSPVVEVLPVVSVGTSYVELNPTNSYSAGYLVGLDPAPCARAVVNSIGSLQFTSDINGVSVGAASTNYIQRAQLVNVGETYEDPNAHGFYLGQRMDIYNIGAALLSRGVSPMAALWSSNPSSPLDRFATPGSYMRDGLDDEQRWANFPQITDSGYVQGMGPFASPITVTYP